MPPAFGKRVLVRISADGVVVDFRLCIVVRKGKKDYILWLT